MTSCPALGDLARLPSTSNGEEGAMSSATGSPWIGDKEDIDGPKDEAGSVGVFHQELFEMQGEADPFAPGEPRR